MFIIRQHAYLKERRLFSIFVMHLTVSVLTPAFFDIHQRYRSINCYSEPVQNKPFEIIV
ncbi:Uncharacterised protein [Leminorella grimontii]|nr:Uncharacterised protein [Leminorella grimontii]